MKEPSLALYRFGHDRARQAGMILADTKFEFGTDAAGGLWLIDEVLTPDSSRYWPADQYAPNQSPPSYDKQFVRDHLLAIKWNQQPPAPQLPRGHRSHAGQIPDRVAQPPRRLSSWVMVSACVASGRGA
jgi:phosphoribosylaminoimidazole-succinocarboxamide synthase